MLRLRTLGGLTIEDENGPLAGPIARKRSLALLALVGLSTEQGISRDRVLAYLWPESDTERARNNLKQTLFQLRQDLHEDVFVRSPGVLRLDSSAISVDACDFQAALDRDNPTTAVTSPASKSPRSTLIGPRPISPPTSCSSTPLAASTNG